MSKQNKYRQLKEISWLCFLTIVFLWFLVLGTTQIYYFLTSDNSSAIKKEETYSTAPENLLQDKVNILVLGVDQRPGDKGRSDTLILVSADPKTKSIHAISIPRDSRVKIPGHGTNKINAAYTYGGTELTKQTVEKLFQVPVHYYFQLNYKALAQAVDRLGGVDLNVEKTMHYTDTQDNLHISLERGYQHLNGTEAMGYVRYRHDALGDIGRIERQQNFIKAVTEQALKPTNLIKLPSIFQELNNNISTDIPTPVLLSLGRFGYQIKDSSLNLQMLPGEGQYLSGASYWIVDSCKLQEIIEPLL